MSDTNQATGKPPRRGGKRLFEPTEEQRKNVKTLIALGIPERAICAIIRDHKDRPISEPTLRNISRRNACNLRSRARGGKKMTYPFS